MSAQSVAMAVLVFGFGIGCAPHRRTTLPPTPPPHEQPLPDNLRSRLEGTWERTTRGSQGGQMTFRSDGSLIFEGSFLSYNPARWELNLASQELILILPNVQDETMMIFLMYLKEGVKSVDRENKRVTFTFTRETESLNVAGWVYNRQSEDIIRSHAREAIE